MGDDLMAALPSTSSATTTAPAVTGTATAATGTSVSAGTSTPTPVTVTLEDPTTYYCGLCRPKDRAMTRDPERGYVCTRHDVGMTDTVAPTVDVTTSRT